ncbi:Protein MAIN-LIKE 1 [Glycine soja]
MNKKLHVLHEVQIMVRIRGLGCALVTRVTGRGRHDEHHADDVRRRYRPTASTRRQQVHVVVAEDVPQVTEDVPHMTEDVAPITADVPAASVEGLAYAIADDVAEAAEGFPGGPRAPSVLTSFGDHVAHGIWTGEEHPDLKLASHGRKVEKIGRPSPEIEGLVAATGLSPLIDCSIVTGNPGLISALVERWHGETSSFHLPMGELTITLDDVSSLLHLSITDTLHSFEPLVVEETVVLLMELLEVSSQEARAETA